MTESEKEWFDADETKIRGAGRETINIPKRFFKCENWHVFLKKLNCKEDTPVFRKNKIEISFLLRMQHIVTVLNA